jgi:glycosyltransferase involved in cell wall biosynthesis
VFCEGNADAIERTLISLRAVYGAEDVTALALLFEKKRYELDPAVLSIAEEAREYGTKCFFGATGAFAARDVLAFARERECGILLFLREGDEVVGRLLRRLHFFFIENAETCGPVYVPRLAPGENPPEMFRNLPPGSLLGAEDTRELPAGVFGTALFAEDALLADTGADSDTGVCVEAVFSRLLRETYARKGRFGLLAEARVTVSAVPPVEARADAIAPRDGRTYLVSCIIPVCNVEKNLTESVDSVLAQSVGFEENVELILVNDGSTDGSGEIYRSYLERYPENIVYIEQGNKGVSAARNAGLDAATGAYIFFLDCGDEADFRFCSECIAAFNTNADCAFVGVRVYRIGETVGLEERFKRSEYKNSKALTENDTLVFTDVCAGMFRKETIENRRFSDEGGLIADVGFLCGIIAESPCYYSANTIYRRRFDITLEWSFSYAVDRLLYPLFSVYEKKAHTYMQMLAVDLIVEFSAKMEIADDRSKLRNKHLEYVLAHTDDVCFDRDFINPLQKIKLYELKYFGVYLSYSAHSPKIYVYTDEGTKEIAPYNMPFLLVQIYEKRGVLHILGVSRCIFNANRTLEVFSDCPVKITEVDGYEKRAKIGLLGCEIFPLTYHEIEIELSGSGDVSFYEKYKDLNGTEFRLAKELRFGASSNLCHNNRFFVGDLFFVRRDERGTGIRFEPFSKKLLHGFIPNQYEFIISGREKTHRADSEFDELRKTIVKNYDMYSKRRIWLFMDRHMEVENNADALFRYCANIEDGIGKWFVIPYPSYASKYKGLNTVVFGSTQYRLLLIFAEKFISSFLFAEGISLRFGLEADGNQDEFERIQNFRQLARQFFRGDIVHLQHGVVFGDISTYLNKHHERFSLIASVCKREFEYLQTLSHSVPVDKIKMTGLPKYDLLEPLRGTGGNEKYILFAPSFDRNVAAKDKYIPEYKISRQYRFIKKFLCSKQLAAILTRTGYRLFFKPHYLMKNNLIDFDFPDYVDIITEWDSKYDVFKKSDLLITDYSGIAFEFAYLEKPVLYAHIVGNTKFEETYWTYRDDGFGEICGSVDELIVSVERYLNNKCQIPEKYKDRVRAFFTYHDTNNCERVYKAIMDLPDTRNTRIV